MRSTTSSKIFSWTRMREPAEQTCPVLKKMPELAARAAASRSASGKMMFADLPPSSSVTRFRLPAAPRRISRPTPGEPGKGDLVHVGMIDQRRAGRLAEARHDVEHAGRNAGLECEFAQPQCRQRGQLGGLQHDGAAAGERRRNLPHADHQREIPRHDSADDAHRFTHGVGQRIGTRGDHLSVDLVGPARVVGQRIEHRRNILAANG